MSYPRTFKSLAEYQGYCKCLSRCKLGDKVEAYFYRSVYGSFYPSITPTNHSKLVSIIGSKYDRYMKQLEWLLGMQDGSGNFWPIARERRELFATATQRVLNIDEYTHAYWAYITDIRIKKVYPS